MRLKGLLSTMLLLAFGILGGGSFDENGNLSGWVWVLLGAIVVIFLIMMVVASNESAKEEERKKQQREQQQAAFNAKVAEYEASKKRFVEQNGEPDKTIVIEQYNLNSEISVYEDTKSIFILGKKYAFKDVVSCTFSDSPQTVHGKMTAVTKSKNGSVIGRSIVGDVVAGPAGAVIGGTTAKKQTEFTQGNDRTVHDYTVIINMDSISNPIIRIHTGEDGKLTNEIVGLMNVVIRRK